MRIVVLPRKSGTWLTYLLLFLALAISVAYWVWRLVAPLEAPGAISGAAAAGGSPVALADAVGAAAVFGRRPDAEAIEDGGVSDLKLFGVHAAGARDSFAIFVSDAGESLPAVVGHEVRPGLILDEVLADQAVLRSGARRIVVRLEEGAREDVAGTESAAMARGVPQPRRSAPDQFGGAARDGNEGGDAEQASAATPPQGQ
ncbi:MAG: hypothetical protein HY778_12595 [Betaproteobacteria bacterium]|nr:hypothetical protein [Betaproteobacteria bacterium]